MLEHLIDEKDDSPSLWDIVWSVISPRLSYSNDNLSHDKSRLLDDADSNLMNSMMYSEWCAWQNDDEQLMRATVKNDDQRLMSYVDQQKMYWPEDMLQQ